MPSEDAIIVVDAINRLSENAVNRIDAAVYNIYNDAASQAQEIAALWSGSAGELLNLLDVRLGSLDARLELGPERFFHLLGGDTAEGATWGPQIAQVFFPAMNNMGITAKRIGELLGVTIGDWMTPFWKAAVQAWTPILEEVLALSPPGLNSLKDVLVKGLLGFVEALANGIGKIGAAALGPFAKILVDASQPLAKELSGTFTKAYGPAFRDFLAHLADKEVPTDGSLLPTINALFDEAAANGMQAHFLSVLSGFDVYGFGLDFGPISAFLADLGDYGRIIDPYIDGHVAALIGRPSQQKANARYPTQLPGMGDLIQFYVKGIIDETAFRDGMKRHGYSDAWIDRYLQHVFVEPPYRELSMMIDSVVPDDAWLYDRLQKAGHSDADAAVLVDALRKQHLKPYINRYLSELFTAHRYGLIETRQYWDGLNKAGLDWEAQGWSLEAAVVAKRRDQTFDVLKILQDAFDREFLSYENFGQAVALLGVDQFTVVATLAAARVKKYRKVYWSTEESQEEAFAQEVKSATSRYLDAYNRGDMLTSDLETLLTTAGLLPEVVDVTVMLAKAKRSERFSRIAQQLGIPDKRERFILGFLSEADYRSSLEAQGLPLNLVNLELAIASAKRDERITGEVKRDILPFYEKGYAEGFLTWEELQSAYAAAKLDPRQEAIRSALAETRRRTVAKGTMDKVDLATWIRAAADYVVSEDEFLHEMEDVGVLFTVREQAKALVPVMRKVERHEKFTEADVKALKAAMVQGLLTANAAGAWLQAMQAREEQARNFINTVKGRTGLEYPRKQYPTTLTPEELKALGITGKEVPPFKTERTGMPTPFKRGGT